MIDKNELCEKIRAIYPDIGQCGIDVDVDYDKDQDRWVVHLKKEDHQLKTYLEAGDAELCLTGRQCIGLSIEINQLRDSLERLPAEEIR
ncbi:MAG: hypothetical protein M0036_10175 [Desulfobacteraceae bacterium]|nr:hypothetical protein [Desulfobacteraceae bacterium]